MAERSSTEGLPKTAQGAEAEIFDWEDGNVLRLPFHQGLATIAEREVTAMAAAASGGVRVPKYFGTVTTEGRTGQILERLDGPDLLVTLQRGPWAMRAGPSRHAWPAARNAERRPGAGRATSACSNPDRRGT